VQQFSPVVAPDYNPVGVDLNGEPANLSDLSHG
jgi:hypothetical protein